MNTLEIELRTLAPALSPPVAEARPRATPALGTDVATVVPPRREQLAEVGTHVLGLAAAVLSVPFLLRRALDNGSSVALLTCSVYLLSLMTLFAASTLYHAASAPASRLRGQRADQCAIFGLIAGTYAPLSLLGLRPAVGLALMGFVGSVAVLGVMLRIAGGRSGRTACLVLYLVSGWSFAAVCPAASVTFPAEVLRLVFQGGVAYTVGVGFFLCRRPYFHTVWHLFVLAGAGLHFAAVYRLVGLS